MFKIGNLEIENNVCLAPMAGVCNSAFRRIVKEYGAGLLFAEMVSDKALMYDSEKTKKMLYMTEEERPIAQQIFGSDKESFVIAAKKVYESLSFLYQSAYNFFQGLSSLPIPLSALPLRYRDRTKRRSALS